jgi:hypothetical protein
VVQAFITVITGGSSVIINRIFVEEWHNEETNVYEPVAVREVPWKLFRAEQVFPYYISKYRSNCI